MIQRIQSIYLFVAAVCLFAVLFVPIWGQVLAENGQKALLDAWQMKVSNVEGESESQSTILIAILTILSGALSLLSVFLYNNRMMQMRVVLLNTLFMCAVLGAAVYYTYPGNTMVSKTGSETYHIGYYLPGIALILNFLARRAIIRDEKLVQSSNRMR